MNILNKRLLSLFSFFLIFGLVFIQSINCETLNTNNEKTNSIDKNESALDNFEADSFYEYGLIIGRKYLLKFKLLNLFAEFIDKSEYSADEAKKQIFNMEKHYPFFLEEIKGLSASLNIKLERLLYLHEICSSYFKGECTTTLSTGDATKNNETFLTHNNDMDRQSNTVGGILHTLLLRMFTYRFKIVKVNTMIYRYAFIGIPILYEYPIINEKGLGFGGNSIRITDNKSRTIDKGDGLSSYLLIRLTMMTCQNVTEVAEYWESSIRASAFHKYWPHHWDGITTVWCDKEGKILCLEQTHNYFVAVFGNSTDYTGVPKGIIWHANHHQWLDPTLTGSVLPEEFMSSKLRSDRAKQLLLENYGSITIETCKNLCRDHSQGFAEGKKDSGDICRHPDKNDSGKTVYSVIIQPKKLTVFITHGIPCRHIFWKYDFTKKFEN